MTPRVSYCMWGLARDTGWGTGTGSKHTVEPNLAKSLIYVSTSKGHWVGCSVPFQTMWLIPCGTQPGWVLLCQLLAWTPVCVCLYRRVSQVVWLGLNSRPWFKYYLKSFQILLLGLIELACLNGTNRILAKVQNLTIWQLNGRLEQTVKWFERLWVVSEPRCAQ